jgi:diguanylate cyclase (GGDEF)-like protein/PAS domain S-box-containing protein
MLRAFVDSVGSPRCSQNIRSVLLALVVTTVAFFAGRALWTEAGRVAPIWLTTPVLLAQMMVAPPRQRHWVLAGAVLANLAVRLFVGRSLGEALAFTSANILEVSIALVFVPRISTVGDLIQPRPLIKFLLGGVLLAPIASGLLATALLGWPLSGARLPTFSHWAVSDALSIAILSPAAVAIWTGEVARLLRAERRMKTAALVLFVCIVSIGIFALKHDFPLLCWAFPPIVLLAFQVDLTGVLVGLVLCLAIALWFTMRGSGPFWSFSFDSMQSRIFALQLYLVATLCIALPISAAQAQRKRLIALLQDSERRYRVLAEHANDIVMSMGLGGRLTYVSPRAKTVLGHAPDDLIGSYYPDLVLPDDRTALSATIEKMARGTTEALHIGRLRRLDGQALWMETHFRLVIDPFSGKPEALTATARDITERKVEEQRLADERHELHGLAYRDGLTGLFNRRHFDRELALRWKQEGRAGGRIYVAVIMIDIDAYKSYNDHYGHRNGDDCLRVVARAIDSLTMRPTDIVARYGGEEFALILRDIDQQGALTVAERIRKGVESLRIPHLACATGIITVSVGVAAQRPRADSDESGLVEAADRALYVAKRGGRNRTCAAGTDDVGHTPA